MAIVEALAPGSDGRRRLGLRSPLGETPIGEITVATAEDVADAIRRARIAQKAWAARTVEERAAIVNRAIDAFLAHQEDIIATLRAETGKTRASSACSWRSCPACDFVNYWSMKAPKDLADHKRKLHGYLRPLKRLEIVYRPLGVVGVITPWNGPFSLATNPTAQALLAGNAVLLKPSEVTPESSAWAIRCFHEAGVPKDVVQVLYGDGETGAALVRGGVDKISFTGSVRTGTKIGIACAEQLMPCTLELGGKDAMIVCADANVERAARGAVFNSMLNTGQVCMGVERVYVMEEIADEFERMVREQVKALRYGPGEDVDVGAVFWDKQLDIIRHHVEDARKRGATIDIGGEIDRTQGVFYKPTHAHQRHARDGDHARGDLRPHRGHHARGQRGRGHPPGQRQRVRPERQRVDQGRGEGHPHRQADRGGLRVHQRRHAGLRRARGALRRPQEERPRLRERHGRAAQLQPRAAHRHRPLGPRQGGPLVPLHGQDPAQPRVHAEVRVRHQAAPLLQLRPAPPGPQRT
jgi:acyl-CoA reductase-like NAD-dependent aldehyde dehydrogenase